MKKLILALIILLLINPVLADFCCGSETDPNIRKCYGIGNCCNWLYSTDNCYNFTITVYGPGDYIVGEPSQILVQIDNIGKYGDMYVLDYEIVNSIDTSITTDTNPPPLNGNPPPNNPLLIYVDTNEESNIEIESGGIDYLYPAVTVISDQADDCIKINVQSVGSGIVQSDFTCISSATASISLAEFSWVGLVAIFILSGSIIAFKKI